MDNEQNSWLEHLQQQGANIVDGRVADFGSAADELKAAVSGDVMIPLTHLGLIKASGADTADFLQGQTSNDVRSVDNEHHQLGSYCTPKGRMLALYTLFKRDDDFYLQLPRAVREPVQKRLTMFVMRSDVKLEDVSNSIPAFALCGPQAEALLQKALGACPAEPEQSLTVDDVTLLRRPGSNPRFICFAPSERLATLWDTLAADATPAGADAWELLEIRAGIPIVEVATVEAFVPQMVNLQRVNGVSFKKGCYPGQEVVARMQYLGKLKRRMYRAHSDAIPAPQAGTELYSAASQSGQGAGKVVRACPSPEGGSELLVVSEISSAEQGPLLLVDENGPQLEVLELPYAYEDND